MKRTYFTVGDFRRNVFIVAASACLGLTACDSGSQNQQQGQGAEWSGGESPKFSQGIITEMTEVSPENWQITGETPAAAGEVAAILHHHDGRVDTLQGLALERQMEQYAAANPTNVHRTGMMDVLMWSGIGYMAGRMMSPNPRYYANSGTMQQTSAWRNQVSADRSRGATMGRGTVRSTAPASGRSGTFSNRSSGFSS